MYHAGFDHFTPEPYTVDEMNCKACGELMCVERDIYGPTSSAEAMAKKGHPHDVFHCKNSTEKWHQQVISLMMLSDRMPSLTITELLEKEIKLILEIKQPTKENWRDL